MLTMKDGFINIAEDDLSLMKMLYTKDELKSEIINFIRGNNIDLPMRKIHQVDATRSFLFMVENNARPIEHGEWFTRYDYRYPLTKAYFKANNKGNIASDYFHQTNRWKCDSINAPSPRRTWDSDKFMGTLLNGMWSLKTKRIDRSSMRGLIGLRKYIASQFRPATALDVYAHFNAENVLDFSSGWGDRLAGFLASDAKSYVGIDPNLNLFDGYHEQCKMMNRNNKQVEMINACAEDVDLSGRTFDLVFTSPPYFNIERYTHDSDQSFKRYNKIEVWLRSFLFTTLEKAWAQLEVGGHMIINISDVYSNHTVNKICDPMNDFISTLDGSEYVGCYGYQMGKRPNSGALKGKSGVFAEPMWVWYKGEVSNG